MKKSLVLLFCSLVICKVYAQQQEAPEPFTSKIYFPASIGVGLPTSNHYTKIKSGLSLNTAVEFRNTYINAFFFRMNYDALTNNYTSNVHGLPTNVYQGKLSTNFLSAGTGYRRKIKRWAIYGIVQPGLGITSFDRAVLAPDNTIVLYTLTKKNFAFKTSAGAEYYIVKHFSLTIEPALYKMVANKGFNASHSTFTSLSVGLNTVIF